MKETHFYKKELAKRYLLLVVGLFIMAFGVAFSICADLGTSPISSLPYVASRITPLTVGNATIIMHCAFIALQILILRRRYQPVQLMQLAVAVVFGYMTDFAVWATEGVSYSAYWQQAVLCIVGIILVGIGVSCEVTAGVITVAGEGLVIAITRVCPIKFSTMKIIFDCSLVVAASALSLIFLHGLYGVREGTIAAAIFVGMTSRLVMKPLRRFERRYIATPHNKA